MTQQASPRQALNVEQLLHLHRLTSDVAKLCQTKLRAYLEALSPLFRPRRILADYIEGPGKESVLGADRNLAELRELYQRVSGRPFDLRRDLASPIESISAQLQIYEWEETHEVRTERERRTITVVSPLTWVLAYPSTYSLSMLRQVLAGKQERNAESVRAFVLRACVLNLVLQKLPALGALFDGLRFQVTVRKSAQTGEMPLVTVSAPFTTMRPSGELMLVATGLSGGNVFQEILDLDAARNLADPLRVEVAGLFREHGEEL